MLQGLGAAESDGRLPEGGDWQDHEQADLPDRASWMFTASLDSEMTRVTGADDAVP